ncbi:MAG TPA: hypothetical protein VN721_10510 [Flavipsychrobacter sp.]|nr:hypothetical protein [Flavipsychrobacter sp.]
MSKSLHPSTLLQTDWIEKIRKNALQAEKNKRLSNEQLELIYQQQWFKLLVPEQYGGLEISLPDVVKLEEAISWMDGSTGWVVTLCAGAGWFGGFLSPSFAGEIFAGEHMCLAGSGAATGIAEIVDDGYKITGKWLHASGAPLATVFTANCVVTQNGKPVKDETGQSVIRSFAFLKDEVTIIHTWNSMGMKATASHAFEVKDLFVPKERCFKIAEEEIQINDPLYRYPFLQLAEATLAANISGMAIHFLDLCEALFKEKRNSKGCPLIEIPIVHDTLSIAFEKLQLARDEMHKAVAISWEECVAQKTDAYQLQQVSNTTHYLAQTARECVDDLYPYCGLTAADENHEINRVWRDIHTASQHSLMVFGKNL